MADRILNIENVLNIIFKTTTKSTQFFADSYLMKDISVISRWRNNSVFPKFEDLKKIVEFAVNESTGVQRVVMKDEILKLLNNSSLKKEIKKVILEKEAFDDFLTEILSALTIEHQSYIMEINNIKSYPGNSTSKYINIKQEDHNIQKDSISENIEDISGDFSGIVKFDLVMLKQNGSKKKMGPGNDNKEFDNSVSLNEKDMNKIKKFILSRMALGIIVLVCISGFFIVQASNNYHSPNLKSVFAIDTVTPAAKESFSPSPSQPVQSIQAESSRPTHTPIPESTPIPMTASIHTPAHTESPEPIPSQKPLDKVKIPSPSVDLDSQKSITAKKDSDNTNSINAPNNQGTINNYYIDFNGNGNDVAVGSSTIIHEKD
ncbi:MAG: hypothetical protein ACOYWZ_02805 [Bacillota bacterium]